MRPCLRKLRVIRPARLGPSRGSWVCVGEDGPCWAPFEPRRRPQAGKSGDPHSQNTDSSPRAQGAPGLGRVERRKGKGEAPRALTACGLGRRVAVDGTWASPLPPGVSATARIGQVPACKAGHNYLRSWGPRRKRQRRGRLAGLSPPLPHQSAAEGALASILWPPRWLPAAVEVIFGTATGGLL